MAPGGSKLLNYLINPLIISQGQANLIYSTIIGFAVELVKGNDILNGSIIMHANSNAFGKKMKTIDRY